MIWSQDKVKKLRDDEQLFVYSCMYSAAVRLYYIKNIVDFTIIAFSCLLFTILTIAAGKDNGQSQS